MNDAILMTPDVCMRFLVWSYYYHNVMPEHMKNDIDNSSLSQKEKEELFEGIEKYYYHDRPLSLRNRMLLWKVKDCHYIKSSTIAKLALPSKKKKK